VNRNPAWLNTADGFRRVTRPIVLRRDLVDLWKVPLYLLCRRFPERFNGFCSANVLRNASLDSFLRQRMHGEFSEEALHRARASYPPRSEAGRECGN
jgi:hypothetical protein